MPKMITVYDLLLSCPSDVSQYIDTLVESVNQFNNHFGRNNIIIIRTRYWSKDVYSEFGKHPQELLNKQIVDTSDMSVAIFWTRFGTKTESYCSGTEEEIERLLALEKQVFLYFLNKPLPPSEVDPEQYKQITAFMNKHKNDGIYFTVPDEKALANKFQENLVLYFSSLLNGAEFSKKSGKRNILWVDDRPENCVYERNILENYGLVFSLALSTRQALQLMEHNDFSVVISDMGRKEGPYEGYTLLKAIRDKNIETPYLIYSNSHKQEHIRLAIERGAQGCTDSASELIQMVLKNLLKS